MTTDLIPQLRTAERLGLGSMDLTDYGAAAIRRGSYDDAAASIHPVSNYLKSKGKGEEDLVGDECYPVFVITSFYGHAGFVEKPIYNVTELFKCCP